jgi:hypothetical protein
MKECVTHHYACDCREEKYAEMEKLLDQFKWRPIATAPKREEEMLLLAEGDDIFIGFFYADYLENGEIIYGWCDEYGAKTNPEFWMPLPASPKKERKR